nr:Glycosyl transferase family 90 [Oceanusvirus sp.]
MIRFDLSAEGKLSHREIRKGHKTRNASAVAMTREAVADLPKGRTASWTVCTEDKPSAAPQKNVPHFNCCGGKKDTRNLYPDFAYDGWFNACRGKSLDEFAQEIREIGSKDPSRPGTVWAGSSATHPNRKKFLRIAKTIPDFALVDTVTAPKSDRIYMGDMGEWEILFDIEGNGFSARTKMLAHSGRPLVLQDRPLWDMSGEHLVDGVNCVACRRDTSDLPRILDDLRSDPEKMKRIGSALAETAKTHFTRAAALDRIRELVTRIAREALCPKDVSF